MRFFVSRHLGLLLCNIAIMKRFLLLFIFTRFLFGQDVLYFKSGEYKKGISMGKVGDNIFFQIEGLEIYNKFSIDLVEMIEINGRKYNYPFDIPKKEYFDTKSISPEKGIIKTLTLYYIGSCCLIIYLFFMGIADGAGS